MHTYFEKRRNAATSKPCEPRRLTQLAIWSSRFHSVASV